MSNAVLVISQNRHPLRPVHPGVARRMLRAGQAAVFKRYPFTIITKAGVTTGGASLRLKIDPGSKVTGLAMLDGNAVIWAGELHHRGQKIKNKLEARRSYRRGRRHRNTRYRQPRFLNRTKPKGWLPPSLQHRVDTVMTWTRRFHAAAPIEAISVELVRFDLQKEQSPEIAGIEYQQGTLAGYEVREYLLEKWQRSCAYCGVSGVPMEIDHIHPRSKGGSDRVSNLCLACHDCNQAKGSRLVEIFLAKHSKILSRIKAQAKAPLKDAAAVNSTRRALFGDLKSLGVRLESGSGGLTKFNRTRAGIGKSHWADAACVGMSTPKEIFIMTEYSMTITSMGHTSRRMRQSDRFGFPRKRTKGPSRVHGFKTGDLILAVVPDGKKSGTHTGRVVVRTRGSFDIKTCNGTVQSIRSRHCGTLHRKDGYAYHQTLIAPDAGPAVSVADSFQ